MDVSTTYFRRLLQSNAPLIFSSNQNVQRSATDSGSYPLLANEMQKLTRLPSQAAKIADALDTNTDGDLFKDFDLSTFMDHFRLDPTAKVTLALACKVVSKQDIKTKGTSLDTTPPPLPSSSFTANTLPSRCHTEQQLLALSRSHREPHRRRHQRFLPVQHSLPSHSRPPTAMEQGCSGAPAWQPE
jgi:hypothetical protein